MQDIEPAVFEALKPSVSRPAGLDTLRQARNMVAHDGCTPSAEDTQRHMALARKTCAELVRVVWDEDINSISHIDLVSSAKERELLRLADGLLEGTVESVPGREGEHVVEPRDRPGAAAGIARAVWDRANVHLAWGTNFANPYKKSSEDRLEHDEHQYERRRAAEVIAVALGVSLADLKRFYKIRGTHVATTPGTSFLHLTHNGIVDAEDARFAVEFTVHWILATESHRDQSIDLDAVLPRLVTPPYLKR